MANPEQALLTQLRNIENRLGKNLAVLKAEVAASGKVRHGEIRSWVMETFGLGYGDANVLAHLAVDAKATPASDDDPLAAIYKGSKADQRAIHDALVAAMADWGPFEAAPKKAYVSFRRKKQFAMLGPKSATRAELGLNLKDDVASDRIVAQKPGGMCHYAVALTSPDDIDADLLAALRRAFDAAG